MAIRHGCVPQQCGSENGPSVPSGPAPFEYHKLLEEWGDRPDFVQKIIGTFIRETQQDLNGLVAAFACQNSAQVTSIAHRLKGAAAAIGAESLRGTAAHIEALGRKGQLEEAFGSAPGLHAEFERLCNYVAELQLTPGA